MKRPSTAQTAARVRVVQDKHISALGQTPADLVITPKVADVGIADFKHAAATAAIGYQAAKEQMDEILTLLRRRDSALF